MLGTSLIGNDRGTATGDTFTAINPATGDALPTEFHSASSEETDRAVGLAAAAALPFGKLSGKEKAVFLRAAADNIEALGDSLVERATAETALPAARIQGERGRTCGQLRLFANLVEEGSWVDARIDHAIPDREPLPKPDVRSMLRPVGPVVVFCASNFPLAFSTAGGDTASALAGGNPVIVKAHHAHPGTAELVAGALIKAVQDCGLPQGVFSLIFGPGRTTGAQLVRHPAVKAVGFTGSRAGGRALMDLAAARPEPIPVFAEMSAINPVFILPGALKERAADIAAGLHGSVTLGVGQFCTNPGVVMVDASSDLSPFTSEFSKLMNESAPATMLTAGICEAYQSGVERHGSNAQVETLTSPPSDPPAAGSARAAAFSTTAKAFLEDESLNDEVFGPATLIVQHENKDEQYELARSLEGQLTATVHGTDKDLEEHAQLLDILETRAGRLVINGFPTGVEVCDSIVHGGPYPATSDGRSTSVGTAAILRFTRPVAYQGFPESSLPDELKDANPLGIARLVDGKRGA